MLDNITANTVPVLDPSFCPAILWNREFKKQVAASDHSVKIRIAIQRYHGNTSVFDLEIFAHEGDNKALNVKYVERFLKFVLWMQGAKTIYIAGCDALASDVIALYKDANSTQGFDNKIIGEKMYEQDLEFITCPINEVPAEQQNTTPLGRHLNGIRIGFDLGGSDRKAATLVDGEVVYSEEIEWNPYFEADPAYHLAGIKDTLDKAIAHIPAGRKLDGIGGSAAGVYIDNKVRVASLFRGISDEDFDAKIKNIFNDLEKEYGVPLVLVNDGEVTALAGSMSLNDNALLGLSMGTSFAAGYVNEEGNITDWINELAFAPIDYRANGPEDEWSKDVGCGVQYFSQQGVARLAPLAGIELPADMPFPEQLIAVQELMAAGDERAKKVYETIGVCFGYAVAYYCEFYSIRNLLILGRVTSGEGGNIILKVAEETLNKEFPEFAGINFTTPDEKNKRHGQAVAAGSLPEVN